jgi:hypothetical protein
MTELRIPDRSAEPALNASLDRGALSRTAAQSEDVSRDAGKGPRDANKTDAPSPAESTSRPEDSKDDSSKPDADEVEEITGVPKTSEELSQM